MAVSRIEISDHLTAWHLERCKLPSTPELSPVNVLETGLKRFPRKDLVHIDIGAGRGDKLDEVAELTQCGTLAGRLTSWGSEKFLYSGESYRKDSRIVSPEELRRKVPPGTAAIATVIAPDPFSPNLANQVLDGISLLHQDGLLFVRSEQKTIGLMLGAGFTVADLGGTLGQEMLRSRYIPRTRLLVGWRNNPELEKLLHDHGLPSMSLVPGEERLKLLGWSLLHCGAHRNIFPIRQLSQFTDLEPTRVREKVDEWSDFTADPYLRRFERFGPGRIIY